ncbi:MAG TPA: ABC transporter ATP-binding protein [Stellaceae bacterium]|nr:ABC transporter ATP-binding protein [Stellaceae bacterium]
MAFIELDDIAKSFGSKPALDGVSLAIERGETLAVFGPSGVGKTVLLRLLAGIMEPDRGDIRIGGASLLGVPPERREVAMAFQNFALYPHLTAFENIASPLRARQLDETQMKRRVGEIASLLRIDHVLDHLPRALSNGQKQRTALARSLVRAPAVLLLDDPLRNVDAKLRYEMRLELPRLFKRFGSTALYVTQDYREAMALGDRIAILLDHRLRQLGTPAEIYNHPADQRVARLFGDPPINLLPARVEASGGGATVRLFGQTLALRHRPVPAASGWDCLVGIRPEDVELSSEPIDGTAPFRLRATTPFSVRTALLLAGADGGELIASTTNPPAAETLWARFDLGRAVLFDAATGTAL